jgi:hypothetical protein
MFYCVKPSPSELKDFVPEVPSRKKTQKTLKSIFVRIWHSGSDHFVARRIGSTPVD